MAGEDSSPLAIEAGPSDGRQIVKVASTSQKSPVASTVDSLTSHNSVHFNPDGAPLTANELAEHFNRERKICPENSRFKKPLAPVMDRRKFVTSASANRTVSYFFQYLCAFSFWFFTIYCKFINYLNFCGYY